MSSFWCETSYNPDFVHLRRRGSGDSVYLHRFVGTTSSVTQAWSIPYPLHSYSHAWVTVTNDVGTVAAQQFDDYQNLIVVAQVMAFHVLANGYISPKNQIAWIIGWHAV